MQVLDLLIFRQLGSAIDARAAAIFTLLSMFIGRFAQNPTKYLRTQGTFWTCFSSGIPFSPYSL
jgi:hypothetical protein